VPALTSRERLLRSLDYRDIDRVPVFFRAEPELRTRLRAQLNIATDAQLAARFGSDAVQVPVIWKEGAARPSPDDTSFYDIYGNLWRSVETGDSHTETVEVPVLAGASSPDDFDRATWVGPEAINFDESLKLARAARDAGLAVYGGVWATVFTASRAMLGEEEYFIALAERPDFVAALVNRLTECYLARNEAYLNACAGLIDLYYFGSDFGTQASMFISPSSFRAVFAPSLSALAAQAKRHGLKVMYHTCGAVVPIIDDLIACGVDVLDPVQVNAVGMEPESLARFRGRIGFNGGISTQTLLPYGTPDEVYRTTMRTIETLGPLGYIVAPDQEMIGDVPVENIDAMVRAAREYKL
jgi:uroporphyrinogen decarboxylase